jgi:hypothetical protein
MANIKKPIKKAQRSVAVDNTRVAKKFDVSKQMKQEKVAKKNEKIDKELSKPYTTVAMRDREGFPGDSIRYYPGKRSGLGVPYTRDMGLKGIAQVSAKDLREASKDKKSTRTYQDTLRVKANFEPEKNKVGGKIAKAKDGKWMQKAAASIKRRGTEGKCTPITKPGCTGKARTLAKTFKKIAKSNKKK